MDEGLDFSGLVSDAGESLYNWGGILPSTKDFVDFGTNLYESGRDFISNIPQQVSEYYDDSGLTHPHNWGWGEIGSDIAGQVDLTTPSLVLDAITPPTLGPLKGAREEPTQYGVGVPEWNPGGVIHEGMMDTRPIVDPIGFLPFRNPFRQEDTVEPWASGTIMAADTIRIFDAPNLNSNMPIVDPDFMRKNIEAPLQEEYLVNPTFQAALAIDDTIRPSEWDDFVESRVLQVDVPDQGPSESDLRRIEEKSRQREEQRQAEESARSAREAAEAQARQREQEREGARLIAEARAKAIQDRRAEEARLEQLNQQMLERMRTQEEARKFREREMKGQYGFF